MILQSVPNSLEMISSLVNDKVISNFLPDTAVDIRELLEFCPGSENDMLDKFGETLTEEEKLFLEEETKLAKQELAHLRCGNCIYHCPIEI